MSAVAIRGHGIQSDCAAVGYVIQEVGLFPHMTVAENIAVVPRLVGWTADRVAARVARDAGAGRSAARDVRRAVA